MATYVLPQVLVFQELNLVPAASQQPLQAFICGGHAHLIRYSEADEQEDGFLDYYDPAQETCFEWPDRPAGGSPDLSYAQVHIKNALLKYFEDLIGAGDSIATVAGKTNRVRAAATNFVENGEDYPRDPDLEDRDVRVGDIALIRAVVGSESYSLVSAVSGFAADPVAATVDTADGDASNQASQSQPAPEYEYVGDADVRNCVDITAVDDTTYDGLEDGDVNEVYTITVIESSASGNAASARLRVRSASGNDDQESVTPAAFGSPTEIGTRGLTVTFSDENTAGCSLSAENNDVSDIDFLVGQEWTVEVGQAFTAPTATAGGSYDGDADVTYIVEVTKGGLYADEPEITVTTDKGIDASGPTVVTAAASAVAVGTHGVTVQFDGTALRKGDRYTIAVTAETDGPIRTLILSRNLPQAVIDNGATQVDLTLFIKKDIDVSEHRYGVPGTVNYTIDADEICLAEALTATDESWTVDGEVTALPVISIEASNFGRVYVTARYWLSSLCSEINTIHDIAELDDAVSGPLHPDNDLKFALSLALANNNGVPVTYCSVCDPSVEENWLTVLDLIDGRDDTYGLVPLTRNATVLNAFFAHVQSQSTETQGRWRVLWTNLLGEGVQPIVTSATSEDGEVVMATLKDNPDVSGTQYTLLQVPAGNGNFVTNGVRAGDTVRYLYTTDGFDGTLYTEFEVDEVVNEDTLILVSPGHTAAVNTPQKVEIHRTLTATELSAAIALSTAPYNNRRVRAVWPDTIGASGYTVAGYFLCAALAALSGGVVPQQGLTNLAISGFTDLSRTVSLFNRTQLDHMAEAGVWIVTQDLQTGDVFTRHALTTGDYDVINEREEVITRNLDSISYFFQSLLEPYIGVSNVVDSTVTVIQSELNAGIQVLRSRNFVQRLGGQLDDGEITDIRRHATLKDRLVVRMSIVLPYPLNNIELHLVV